MCQNPADGKCLLFSLGHTELLTLEENYERGKKGRQLSITPTSKAAKSVDKLLPTLEFMKLLTQESKFNLCLNLLSKSYPVSPI